MATAKIFFVKEEKNLEKNVPKISVVVPMYNVEKYLNLCLTTILNQTFKDFELILVDDCSTDKTLEIAKSFDDTRIKIIRNKKNMGKPGPVRNVGLSAARGEYVYFCDSDDAILPQAFESLYNAIENNSADVSTTFGWYIAKNPEFQSLIDVEVELHNASTFAPVAADLKTRLYQEFLLQRIHIAPYFYLYRRKFLINNNIKFLNEVAEDVFFNFDVICATGKIVKIKFPFYIYRIYQNSVSHNSNRLQKNIQSIPALNDHIEKKLAQLNDPDFTRLITMYWVSHVMGTHIMGHLNQNGSGLTENGLLKGLAPRFGNNASFIATLLCLYKNVTKENQFLKINLNKLSQENQNLKKSPENIRNDLIAENETLKKTLESISRQINGILRV